MREKTLADYLDWGGLILQAKKQGLSKKEIREYLQTQEQTPNFFTVSKV